MDEKQEERVEVKKDKPTLHLSGVAFNEWPCFTVGEMVTVKGADFVVERLNQSGIVLRPVPTGVVGAYSCRDMMFHLTRKVFNLKRRG